MDIININGTPKTPSILSDPGQGIIEIKGRSNPENASQFYKPLFDWVSEYVQTPLDKTIINVQLEHFNTSSSKCLLEVFKKLENIKKANKDVVVNWYYEKNDEDILEAGENYGTMTSVPFKMIPF